VSLLQIDLIPLLALGYGLRKKENKKEAKRRSTNYVEGTLTENGSKWSKNKKRRSEVREIKYLNEKFEEDI
jgi:hypothetical protein